MDNHKLDTFKTFANGFLSIYSINSNSREIEKTKSISSHFSEINKNINNNFIFVGRQIKWGMDNFESGKQKK